MPQKSYNKESKLFLLAFGKKNLTVTLKKGRKKATINKANYFYWYLEKNLTVMLKKGGTKRKTRTKLESNQDSKSEGAKD